MASLEQQRQLQTLSDEYSTLQAGEPPVHPFAHLNPTLITNCRAANHCPGSSEARVTAAGEQGREESMFDCIHHFHLLEKSIEHHPEAFSYSHAMHRNSKPCPTTPISTNSSGPSYSSKTPQRQRLPSTADWNSSKRKCKSGNPDCPLIRNASTTY